MTFIDKDEWMEVWNSNNELQQKVKTLETIVKNLMKRLEALEEPITMYGKEVKRR